MKYVICPGTVTSQSDGERHYIGVAALMTLYKLKPGEFTIYDELHYYPKNTVFLYPRYNGDYRHPSEYNDEM